MSAGLMLIFAAGWVVLYRLEPARLLLAIVAAGAVLGGLCFYLPLGRTAPMRIGAVTERVDERDVVFAREEYLPGTEKHAAYYAMRPENLAADNRIRGLPELLAPGGQYYEPVGSTLVAEIFHVIEGLLERVDGPVAPQPMAIDQAQATRMIKQLVLHLGANDVGVAALDPMFVYSHVGRGPEPWGQPTVNSHRFAVAFALEMDHRSVNGAPGLAITEESATQYLKGGQLSIALAEFIRSLGWPARAHMAGSNYQIMVPPVAHAAGLGEIGRMGYLIHPRLGPRVRLGAVTTDLPLVADAPVVFGVQDFCARCRKCAVHCPSGSIPPGDPVAVRGVVKWPLAVEQCLHYWRVIGTDCGLCMKVCPFSHPPTLAHSLVRAGIARSAFARALSVWGDALLYGR